MWFNPIICGVLRSPLHGLLSKHMLVLSYTGRRSGKVYTIPVDYIRDGEQFWLMSSPERTWWRNLQGGAQVALLLKREIMHATATAYPNDRVATRAGISATMREMPQVARILLGKLPPDQPLADEQIDTLMQRRVMINVVP